MGNNSNKHVVAISIGSALFVIIGSLINIPAFFVPNTSLQLQYALLALIAIVFGPTVGFFTGFIGHALKDAILYGSLWWSWIIVSGFIGFGIGAFANRINIQKGYLTKADLIYFNIVQIVVNFIGWGIIAPAGDILFYSEPASKVFSQGVVSAVLNAVTIGVGGTLLLILYAKKQVKSSSLKKD